MENQTKKKKKEGGEKILFNDMVAKQTGKQNVSLDICPV